MVRLSCGTFATTHPGGAEVELSILFADVRGSTAMAENMTPASFKEHIGRFHAVATEVLISAEAMLDKIVGDEVGGLSLPIVAGRQHARVAVQAAQALSVAVAQKAGLPVGVGVHTGARLSRHCRGRRRQRARHRRGRRYGQHRGTARLFGWSRRGPGQRSRVCGIRIGLERAAAKGARAEGET